MAFGLEVVGGKAVTARQVTSIFILYDTF